MEYVDVLADTLGGLRGLDSTGIGQVRDQLRSDLSKQVALAAPNSSKAGPRKSDGVLQYDALDGMKRLLRSESAGRVARGDAPLDLSYSPETSGPGLFDVFSTSTNDLAVSLKVDFMRANSYALAGRAPLTRSERGSFNNWASQESKQIDPAVVRAMAELENARRARERIEEGQSSAVVTESSDATITVVEGVW